MRIFIDIDNIIADFEAAFRKFLNRKTRKKLRREDIREFDFFKSFNIPKEEERKYHDEFAIKGGYKKLKKVKGCKEAIERLAKYEEIRFISSRSAEKRQVTIDWFKKNKIPLRPDQLILSNDKVSYFSRFDVILEDRWEDSIALAESNTVVILFDYPWNRKRDATGNAISNPNIFRVSNWQEAIEVVDKVAEERFKKPLNDDVFRVWRESIGVQMHFNQLIMRNRITFSSVIFTAFSAALALLRFGGTIVELGHIPIFISDAIVGIAVVGLISYFIIDTQYYLRLLLGSVEFTEKMDKEYKSLGLTSSIIKNIIPSKAKKILGIHYWIFFLALVFYLSARIFF